MVTLADPETAGEVVHPERAAQHRARACRSTRPPLVSTGTRNGQHADEMRRVLERPLSFGEPLVDQAKFALVEVAESAVHELRAPRAGTGREVVSFHQRGSKPAGGGIERDARAGDSTTDDEQVEVGVPQSPQSVVALETRTIGSVWHTPEYRPLRLELASATAVLHCRLTQVVGASTLE